LIQDARKLDLKDGSADFICSNNTLEHIPHGILEDILKEFGRILKPGAIMSHFIDMSDHFAHFDQRITIYNFLKFSNKKWAIIDNRIQPQNRLRFKDYLRLYHRADHALLHQETRVGSRDILATINIHPEFSGYSSDELAISHASLISQKQLPDHVV
jgi:SAM-dependent methyltransferase